MSARLDDARRFARSLDEEDYETTRSLLSPACVYEIGGRRHDGVEAILASYRAAADWVNANLDSVRYESSVRAGADGGAVVDFVDHLEHGGRRLTHRCEQHLAFDGAGRIVSIRHVDPPGEAEAVRRFLDEAGLSRS